MTSARMRRSVAVGALLALIALSFVLSGEPVQAGGSRLIGNGDGSGGRAIAHRSGAKKVSAKGQVPDARLFRLGVNSGEPTVGVTNNGWVFTSAFQTNTRVEVLRTRNRGKSWEVVSPQIAGRNSQLLSLDPYTWVDNRLGDKDASRLFTIDLTVDCSILSFSDDGGKNWITNPLACGRPVNDHQTLFGGPPKTSTPVGYENVLYYCWNDVASSSCSKSTTGGLTWSPTGTPAFLGYDPDADSGIGAKGVCGGLHGHGHVDYDGNVYLPRSYCERPYLAISRDEGVTWETHLVSPKAGDGDSDPSVAVDEKGNIYYLWIGLDRLPYLAVSSNGGKDWTKPMMVAPPGVNEANLPSLDVGKPGHIALTYMGTENGPNKPRFGQKCQDSKGGCPQAEDYRKATWNAYMTISTDALAKEPTFLTTTANDPKDPLLRGTCGPGRCSNWILDFIDVVIGPHGDVWASYVDECVTICITGETKFGSEGVIGTLVGAPRLR